MSHYKPYPAYKDSGVEWIGKIPEEWNVKPLFSIAEERNNSNKGMIENNLLSLSYGFIVKKDINSFEGLVPESYETYQIVEKNDIVFRLTDLQNDKRSLRSAICRERGIITSAYLVLNPKTISSAYLSNLMRSYDQTKVFYSMGGGMRQSMKYGDMRRMMVLQPSNAEQLSISNFLDRETARIDSLIAKKTRFIELLKEKRQALITQAVTKGLDPHVKMKDSGVEWIGKIPEEWNVKPLFSIAEERNNSNKGMIENNLLSLSYGCIVKKDINSFEGLVPESYETYQIVEKNDIIFRLTDLQNDKRSLRSAICRERGIITSAYLALNPKKISSAYLSNLMRSYDQTKVFYSMGGGMRQSMKYGDIRRMMVLQPSNAEQLNISNFLDRETARIDVLIQKSENSITLLKERRSALITAAVTGQIDLREAA